MRSEINSSSILYFIIFLEGNIFLVNDVLSRKKFTMEKFQDDVIFLLTVTS